MGLILCILIFDLFIFNLKLFYLYSIKGDLLEILNCIL